ncbi:MAG: hypothetical protein LV479_03355 [Methylacidiphilales bacterium]|nr:hypothetical protein [Candidatus Methylacidiphilales bacterium]
MLVLAAAARAVVGTGRGFASPPRLDDFNNFTARMLGLAPGDPDTNAVALGGEGNEDNETLKQTRKAITAEDDLFDDEIENLSARWSGRGIGSRFNKDDPNSVEPA